MGESAGQRDGPSFRIVSDIENPFFPEVIKGFEQRAREQSYDVILSDTNYDAAVMTEATKRMLRQRERIPVRAFRGDET